MSSPKEKPKRFIIYTRISVDDKSSNDFTSLDVQSDYCKKMLEAFNYEVVRMVKDDGYSGKDLNRPGIQSILKEITPGAKRTFDGIIFFRLDRLTRNPRDFYALIDLFKEND
ncbi:MAG: recombinase family protein, partial [Candidatus Omnitrophica bacterium]|nr:recombinase family protein [Candidatus Omnitrophota bacterium]